MRVLRLVGPGEDGTAVIVETDTGEQFSLPIDERLRAASRADRAHLGQLEAAAAGPLRPRDIQIRVRAGESPQELADHAGMPLERVMRFAYPVLAERTRVADEARRARARRTGDGHLVPFGELVDSRFALHGIEPETVGWDAFRRPDGGWTVIAEVADDRFPIRAKFSFSLGNRTVSALDDVAADLISGRPVKALALASGGLVDQPADIVASLRFGGLSAVADAPLAPRALERRERAFTHPLPVSVDDEMFDQDVFDQELADANSPAGFGAGVFAAAQADQDFEIERYVLPGSHPAPAEHPTLTTPSLWEDLPVEASTLDAHLRDPNVVDLVPRTAESGVAGVAVPGTAGVAAATEAGVPGTTGDAEAGVAGTTGAAEAGAAEAGVAEAGVAEAGVAGPGAASTATPHRRGGRHGDKPRMPSWDDILLGVRRKTD